MRLSLESLEIFVQVADLGSFTRAGEVLAIPKARTSLRIKSLESELGCRLLQRSTRVVRLTPEGEELLPRARRLLADAEEIGALAQAARGVRGRVRIDLPVSLARTVLLPRLPELFARHPNLELVVSTTDRRVEPLREGFDCVLRVGGAADPALIQRRLGVLAMVNCASPAYLQEHGTPTRLEDLDRHWLVHYSSRLGNEPPAFEYREGDGYGERAMKCLLTVNSSDAYTAACLAGLGIIQVPRIGARERIASGDLVEILPDFRCSSMPVCLLHTHGRTAPRRVRTVMGWIAEVLAPVLADA